MVMTRSKAKVSKENELDSIPSTKNVKEKSIKIKIIPNKPIKKKMKLSENNGSSESDSDYESDSDNEDIFQENYLDYIKTSVLKNKKLKKKIDGIISYIESETITLENILNAKIRKKHKAELFEMCIIYDNISILSDEKQLFRNKMNQLLKVYETQYQNYLEHKKEMKLLESSKYSNDLFDFPFQIVELNTSLENKKVIYSKYLELMEKKTEIDDEYFKLKNWIQFALKLPFDNLKTIQIDIDKCIYLQKIKTILDQELYGMNKVKEQILLFIHSKLMNPNVKGCCLGLVGVPGVGKTSIARCLSKILDIPFSQISFGGIHSADFIKGYDYTYVGSKPGEIVRCLSRMKYKNGILFLDEYEKISNHPDIIACLLHITDFSQNNEFRDNYLNELTIDLSSIWFIYSMNELPSDQALKDRIFFIQVDGYQVKDQIQILCHYLLPKHLENLNLNKDSIILEETVAEYMIQKYGNQEKGVRTIEKHLKDVIQKISFLVTNQNKIPTSFNLNEKYLPIQFPFTIDKNILDVLLSTHLPSSTDYMNMYI